jgi:superfamily II DNA or RNA helicase
MFFYVAEEMNLRPYQQDSETGVSNAFANGRQAVILCVPTGGGKTIIFASMTRKSLAAGWSVLIICNRKELIAQANEKLKKQGLHPTLIIPTYRGATSNLYLASIDTLRNREFPQVDLVIIDECHIRAFDPIVLHYKAAGALIIGCTATPIRMGKASLEAYPDYTGQLCDVYEEIIEPVRISQLIKDEYLVPAIYYGPAVQVSNVKMRGQDYDEKELYKVFDKPKLYDGVVDNYLKHANGTKALVFNINVEHSQKMTEAFRARGIASEHVDGKTKPRERDAIFARFKAGQVKVLNNCSVATTGYDEPSIETIIINRATMSLSLMLQMIGRGARPYEDKDLFIVIDQGGNVRTKHGYWHEDREWSLDRKYVSKTIGAAPIKECDNCEALIPASATVCKFCEMAQAKAEAKALEQTDFVLIDSNNIPKELRKELHRMTIPELEKYRELKEYKVDWLVHHLYARGDQALKEYGALKGYATAWAYRHMKIAEEKRNKAKEDLWDFLLSNPHLDDNAVQDFAVKKLKGTHNKEQLLHLLPKIVAAKREATQ